MGYPKVLDEHNEDDLHSELERRRARRNAGLCDYCGASAGSSSCRFKKRHAQARMSREGILENLNEDSFKRFVTEKFILPTFDNKNPEDFHGECVHLTWEQSRVLLQVVMRSLGWELS